MKIRIETVQYVITLELHKNPINWPTLEELLGGFENVLRGSGFVLIGLDIAQGE